MTNAIENAVNETIRACGVTFTAALVGATVRDKWECDQWRVVFDANGKRAEFDYYTGTGHRKSRRAVPAEVSRSPNTLYAEAWRKENMKPVAPCAASAVHALLLDAQAANSSFANWCADFGYDEDSRKALEMYLACQETGRKLATVFTPNAIDRLTEQTADY